MVLIMVYLKTAAEIMLHIFIYLTLTLLSFLGYLLVLFDRKTCQEFKVLIFSRKNIELGISHTF